MKRNNSRGRPMASDKIRVIAERRDEVDVEKLAQALIILAKEIAEKNSASSQPNGEEKAGLPTGSELS